MVLQVPFPPGYPDLPPPGPMENFLAVIALFGLVLLVLPEKWRKAVIKGLFGNRRED